MPEKLKIPSEFPESAEETERFDFRGLIYRETASHIKDSLQTPEDLTDFEKWRKIDEAGREARQLRKISETLTAAKSLSEKQPDKKEEISQQLLETLNLREGISFRTRVEQFQALLTAEVLGLEKPRVKKEVEKLIAGLRKIKSTEGELNAFELMSSPRIGFGLKKEWLESQFLPRISFLNRRDLEEAKKIPLPPTPVPPEKPPAEEVPPIPELPPEDQDFLRPSIEEMEKREGEPTGYFTAVPFYGGYWKEKIFEEWDPKNICFRTGLKKIKEAEEVAVDEKTERVMQGFIIGGTRTPLPCAYNFVFNPKTLKFLKNQEIKILEDEEGNYLLEAQKEGIVPFSISLAKRKEELKARETPRSLEIEMGELNEETEKFIAELKKEKIPPLEKARKLKQYVKKILEYPAKGDSSYNTVYYQEPAKFFQKIEQFKKADCDVANTFFIALLSILEIPARLAVGHYVKVKDHQGRAVFSSGTRHAWTEVWDDGWQRLDATPKGAPEMDEEETDEKQEDENFEGDFGEIEAETLSDEELEEMIEEIKKIQEKKEREKPPEEIRALNFSQEAGCSPEEAKQILKELERAQELKDSKGRKILDLLSQEFMKIIKENLKEVPSYRAPVRLPGADELEEPVEAWIDIESGEAEPGGFKKYEKKTEKVQEYGGFDVILVCDKSGSMGEVDPVSGKIKYQEQQLGNFLLIEALHQFSRFCKIYKIKLINPIDVRTALITFQDAKIENRKIQEEVVLPLADKWGPKEQFTIWKKSGENIGGGTPDNLGLRAARQIIEKDIEEAQKERKKQELKKRLRMVIVLADGGTDTDKVADREREKKLLQDMDVIVAGLGLTEAASAMKAAYYPNGDYVKSVSEMPEWVAQIIISQVQKLYPKKIKR